jgi:anthranilate synthase/aminodeoxychorismate synthase-like glutamine amidotransferase
MPLMNVLIVDNYDSFVFNIYQYVGELGASPLVVRHDELVQRPDRLDWADRVVISPGPGRPEEAAGSLLVLERARVDLPILGVCLGHQAIGAFFGASVVRARQVMHGHTSRVHHDGQGVFAGLPSPLEATRYHSLVVDPESVPPCLVVSAWTEDEVIMGLRHRERPIEGVQFHPESVLSEHGHDMIARFLGQERSHANEGAAPLPA